MLRISLLARLIRAALPLHACAIALPPPSTYEAACVVKLITQRCTTAVITDSAQQLACPCVGVVGLNHRWSCGRNVARIFLIPKHMILNKTSFIHESYKASLVFSILQMKLAIPAALVAGSGALYYFFGDGAMRALSIV